LAACGLPWFDKLLAKPQATWVQAGMVALLVVCAAGADDPNAITAEEATKKVNEKVTVRMVVKTTKDRLEKRGEIYLDSEEDFHNPKNLGVVITRAGAAKLKEAGVDDPAAHYKDKTIQVTGTVILKESRPRIEVDDAKKIKIVEKK
jgi:hypothetical protein